MAPYAVVAVVAKDKIVPLERLGGSVGLAKSFEIMCLYAAHVLMYGRM